MPEPEWKSDFQRTLDAWVSGGPVVKREAYTSLVAHVEAAYKRGVIAGRSQAGYRKQRELPGAKLTEQQLIVARLVARGLTNAEVALTAHLAEDTVKSHLRGAFEKLGVKSRSHLAALLVAYGQAEPRGD